LTWKQNWERSLVTELSRKSEISCKEKKVDNRYSNIKNNNTEGTATIADAHTTATPAKPDNRIQQED